jgi:O-antigen ligase
LREIFNHPHNAYLEMLFDNGIFGLLCVLPIYLIFLRKCISLFRDRQDVLLTAAGGVGLALVLALLVAGVGAQTLYPREGVLGMWAALGVALRVWVEREQCYSSGEWTLAETEVDSDAATQQDHTDPAVVTYA